MSKKTFFTLFIIFILLAGGAGFFYFYYVKPAGLIPGITNPDNSNLFPFGNSGTGSNAGTGNGGTQPVSTSSSPVPRLRQLSTSPLGGETSLERSKKTYFRYIERATGHVSETPADSLAVVKVTNTTIPKIYEALWAKDGGGALLRYLKDDEESVQSFYASIGKASTGTPAALTGTFLAQNISDTAFSPSRQSFGYVIPQGAGAALFSVDISTLKPKQLFSSPLHEWTVFWPEKNTITLTSSASSAVEGFMYKITASTGAARKVLGGIKGLTTRMSPDGKEVLYSGIVNGVLKLRLLTLANNEEITLPFNTLPEKCVWSQKVPTFLYCAVPSAFLSSQFPDTWYQSKESFVDDIWGYDSITGSTTHVLDPASYNQSFDVINLDLDSAENFLLFINKKDLTGWVYKLAEN